MAYVYLLGWSSSNQFYIGVRFAKGCSPEDLLETYFTSSKYVKEKINTGDHPNIKRILKTFDSAEKARKYEEKLLTRLKVMYDDRFLNKTNNRSIPSRNMSGKNNGMFGKKHKPSTIEKMKGEKSSLHKSKLKGKRPHVIQKGKMNNNFKGYYITPWGMFDSISEAAEKADFKIPVSTLIGLCKYSEKTPMKKKNKYNIPVGKTPSDVGYSFIKAGE